MALQRSGFKVKRIEPGTAVVPVKAPKPPKGPRMRKCKVCREPFQPRNMSHAACNLDCALELAKQVRAAQEMKAHKARKVAAKSRMQFLGRTHCRRTAHCRIEREEMSRFVAFWLGVLGLSLVWPVMWWLGYETVPYNFFEVFMISAVLAWVNEVKK